MRAPTSRPHCAVGQVSRFGEYHVTLVDDGPTHPASCAIDARALSALEDTVAARVLGAAIMAVTGAAHPPSWSKLDRTLSHLRKRRAATVSRADCQASDVDNYPLQHEHERDFPRHKHGKTKLPRAGSLRRTDSISVGGATIFIGAVIQCSDAHGDASTMCDQVSWPSPYENAMQYCCYLVAVRFE